MYDNNNVCAWCGFRNEGKRWFKDETKGWCRIHRKYTEEHETCGVFLDEEFFFSRPVIDQLNLVRRVRKKLKIVRKMRQLAEKHRRLGDAK